MSVYAINKICRDALHDLAFREAVKRDPAAAITLRDLGDDERERYSPATWRGYTSTAVIRS